MTKLRLSNSQINTFEGCNRQWRLDKQDRLRPNWKGSPLLMGSALDAAVEHILLNLNEKKSINPKQVFEDAMRDFEVNGVEKHLPKDLLSVRIGAGDFQLELLNDGDIQNVSDYASTYDASIEPDRAVFQEFLDYCKQQRKTKTALDKKEQTLYNHIGYTSLLKKGFMMIPVVHEWIKENVKRVISVQKKIDIENNLGDRFIGYLDFVVELKDGTIVLIDLKTSSNPTKYYPEDCVRTSRQLGIYAQEEKITTAAYLVLDKVIRKTESKRGPRVRLTYIQDEITEEQLDKVFGDIEEATIQIKEALETGCFPKNKDSCFNFGGCDYLQYCNNGSMVGLEYVKK